MENIYFCIVQLFYLQDGVVIGLGTIALSTVVHISYYFHANQVMLWYRNYTYS